MEQWICPPYHGKEESDTHGTVVKRKAKLYLVIDIVFYY